MAKGEAAANKAVALAPQGLLGYRARADLEKARELDPDATRWREAYGELLETFGKLPEAIAISRKGTELDTLRSRSWFDLAQTQMFSPQFSAAHESLRRAFEINPESGAAFNILGGAAAGRARCGRGDDDAATH
jgi:tetratricopeptide (TPR) repeat protein